MGPSNRCPASLSSDTVASYLMHLDESLRGNLLSVGGFICDYSDLASIEAGWMDMRRGMGLEDTEPLKWNYGSTSTVRRRIEADGWTNIERRAAMIEVIRDVPVTLMADVLYDDRGGRRPALDFYRHALDWLVLRFRNYVTDIRPRPPGPHYVVLDKPSPAPAARPGFDDPQFRWLQQREQIWYLHYQNRYWNGFAFAGRSVPPLRTVGFYPSVVVAHAKFNPLLEIADAVAGLALDFVEYNLRDNDGDLPHVGWQDENLIRVARCFRAHPSGNIYRWGFMVCPDRVPAEAAIAGWVRRLSRSGS